MTYINTSCKPCNCLSIFVKWIRSIWDFRSLQSSNITWTKLKAIHLQVYFLWYVHGMNIRYSFVLFHFYAKKIICMKSLLKVYNWHSNCALLETNHRCVDSIVCIGDVYCLNSALLSNCGVVAHGKKIFNTKLSYKCRSSNKNPAFRYTLHSVDRLQREK